jgi:hypothetical protein
MEDSDAPCELAIFITIYRVQTVQANKDKGGMLSAVCMDRSMPKEGSQQKKKAQKVVCTLRIR